MSRWSYRSPGSWPPSWSDGGRDASAGNGGAHRWVFPSTGTSGHAVELQHLYRRISPAAGTKFWFHGLRNVFITVAERELMLPRSLTKRLVNHARGSDITESYAANWSVDQLREPAQRIADRIDELARGVATDRVGIGQPWLASGASATVGETRFRDRSLIRVMHAAARLPSPAGAGPTERTPMHIGFLGCGTGSARAAADYLVGERGRRRARASGYRGPAREPGPCGRRRRLAGVRAQAHLGRDHLGAGRPAERRADRGRPR